MISRDMRSLTRKQPTDGSEEARLKAERSPEEGSYDKDYHKGRAERVERMEGFDSPTTYFYLKPLFPLLY